MISILFPSEEIFAYHIDIKTFPCLFLESSFCLLVLDLQFIWNWFLWIVKEGVKVHFIHVDAKMTQHHFSKRSFPYALQICHLWHKLGHRLPNMCGSASDRSSFTFPRHVLGTLVQITILSCLVYLMNEYQLAPRQSSSVLSLTPLHDLKVFSP